MKDQTHHHTIPSIKILSFQMLEKSESRSLCYSPGLSFIPVVHSHIKRKQQPVFCIVSNIQSERRRFHGNFKRDQYKKYSGLTRDVYISSRNNGFSRHCNFRNRNFCSTFNPDDLRNMSSEIKT